MSDTSVFKKLAHNDTGSARGHQGGIVVPKAIAIFYPPLPSTVSGASPTVDNRIKADLFVDGSRVASVETRYQHQSWGGSRSVERRLTDNLGPLRNLASEDDIVLFTKDLSDDFYIHINLLRKGTLEYQKLNARIGSDRWGTVNRENPPVSTTEIKDADDYIDAQAISVATPFTTSRLTTVSITVLKARERAFRNKILQQHDYRCAFTGRRFVSPISNRTVGLDAAHIVPVEANGSDHPGNGLPLTKELHWAFDRGLVGVGPRRTIVVPKSVASLVGNEFLRDLDGVSINEATTPALRVLDEALEWHRSNVLLR